MKTSVFYAELRASNVVFGKSLTNGQVLGINAILDGSRGLPTPYVAYLLATAFHETGTAMMPATENLNYSVEALLTKFSRARISEADARKLGRTTAGRRANQEGIANAIYGGDWGRRNLGNMTPGDGWLYRGRGLVQITGLANYKKFGIAGDPEGANDLKTAVHCLIHGSVKGLYSGKKLGDFLDKTPPDYVGAREVINGTDAAQKIATYAVAFEHALTEAAWGAEEKAGWLSSLLKLFQKG